MSMLDKMKIRVLDENDLDAVVDIDSRVLGRERRSYWKRKIAYAGIYPRPAFVAEIEGKVVGFILGYVSGWEFGVPDSVGWIDTLGVDPAYQRQGIGKALFYALMETFKRTGVEETNEMDETGKMKVAGVDVVYTLAGWDDWDLVQFFHAMGFKKGNLINLELKIK